MSETRRHRKRRASEARDLAPNPAATTTATTAAPPKDQNTAVDSRPVPMPDWKWKTFPVYFAFAMGGFIGMYTGVIAGAADNPNFFTFFAIFWAILLGVGFSRFTTRWIMSRQWAQKRARKRNK